MPRLTIVTDDGEKSAEVPSGKRLVLAIEGQGVDIGHRCGGNARCTTCQVDILEGEPDVMTAAEYAVLNARGLYGQVRLSCQLVCDHDYRVRPRMTKQNQGWDSTGGTPDESVTPEAKWLPRAELESSTGGG